MIPKRIKALDSASFKGEGKSRMIVCLLPAEQAFQIALEMYRGKKLQDVDYLPTFAGDELTALFRFSEFVQAFEMTGDLGAAINLTLGWADSAPPVSDLSLAR